MSDNNNNNNAGDARPRRGSIGGLASMFRSNSISQVPTNMPGPISTAITNDRGRRVSISTLGLANSPTASFSARRSSMSTNSDSIDENAIEEDDGISRTAPTTPFTRRMSFGAPAMRTMRGSGSSPNTSNGRLSPSSLRRASTTHKPSMSMSSSANNGGESWSKITSQASTAQSSRAGTDVYPPSARSDQGFNWSEQLRSRAESTVAAGPRPSFSLASGLSSSPPRINAGVGPTSRHDRAKSVSEMPAPPAQAPKPRPQKPDHMQERILKGDFYMD